MEKFKIKRNYEEPSKNNGYLALVNRLCPRSFSKKDTKPDSWIIEIAPNTESRKWLDRKQKRFEAFSHLFIEELQDNEGQLNELRKTSKRITEK